MTFTSALAMRAFEAPPALLVKRGSAEALSRINSLLSSADRSVRQAFLSMVAQVKDTWTLDYLASVLGSGDIERALLVATQNASVLGSTTNTVYTTSASGAAADLTAALGVRLAFDQVNHRAVEEMRSNSLRLIREFTQQQRDALRTTMVEGVTQGINPRDVARLMRGSVGLTDHQMGAVLNYRRLLEQSSSEALNRALRDRRFDPTVARAIARGQSLSPEQVSRMVERYQQRYVARRAETIARTESLRAVHQGANEMYRQALDAGHIQDGEVERVWNATLDSRTRDSHAEMDGQRVGMNEPFTTGDGYSIMYPGDPSAPGSETINCRCAVTVELKPVPKVPVAAPAATEPTPLPLDALSAGSQTEQSLARYLAEAPDNGVAGMARKELASIKRELQDINRLDYKNNMVLYHLTGADNVAGIEARGLVPAAIPPIGQSWEAVHSSYGTYFHASREAIISQMQQLADLGVDLGDYRVVEVKLPFNRLNASRILPDEDVSLNPKDWVGALRGGSSVSVTGGASPSEINSITSGEKWKGLLTLPEAP